MKESFGPVVDAYRASIDEQLERADSPQPDLAAVLTRARQLGSTMTADAEPEALGIDEDPEASAALADFVDAYRQQRDHEVDAAAPPRPSGKRLSRVTVVLGLVAAAAIAVWALGSLRGSWVGSTPEEPSGQQAVDAAASGGRGHGGFAASQQPPLAPRTTVREAKPPIESEPGLLPEVDPEPEAEPDPPALEPAPSRPTKAARSVEQRIETLDAEARRAWRRGDLAKAERKFRALIDIGKRRRAAEVAYGDLFAVVKQRRHSLVPVWNAYLRRFPKGRFAEDASAGLCGAATGDARSICWDRYREKFPRGRHQDHK